MSATISKLVAAANAHDLDAMTVFFHPDCRCVQPAHPARAFVGRSLVRGVTLFHILDDLVRPPPRLTVAPAPRVTLPVEIAGCAGQTRPEQSKSARFTPTCRVSAGRPPAPSRARPPRTGK